MLHRTFIPFPVLKTERLTLRQLVIHDEQEIFSLRSDTDINKYLDRHIAHTIDDAREFIKSVHQHIRTNDALYWAITFSDKNILVGTICLFSFSEENETCEIGYELLTNFQGQGIMSEAVEKVIDYAFNTIKIQKIDAFFHRDNQDSIKLLKKFSFRDSNESDKTDPDVLCYYLIHSDTTIK